jgi:hypothetical protein
VIVVPAAIAVFIVMSLPSRTDVVCDRTQGVCSVAQSYKGIFSSSQTVPIADVLGVGKIQRKKSSAKISALVTKSGNVELAADCEEIAVPVQTFLNSRAQARLAVGCGRDLTWGDAPLRAAVFFGAVLFALLLSPRVRIWVADGKLVFEVTRLGLLTRKREFDASAVQKAKIDRDLIMRYTQVLLVLADGTTSQLGAWATGSYSRCDRILTGINSVLAAVRPPEHP